MAEQLSEQIFRKSPESIISYNYQNIVQGTGMALFYGVKMVVSGPTSTYHLIEETFDIGVAYSATAGTYDANNNGMTLSPNATFTFDTNDFKIQQIFKGVAYAIIPIVAFSESATDSSVTVSNVKLVLVHADASTTDLTNDFDLPVVNQTVNYVAGNSVMTNCAKLVIFNDVAATTIKVGEKIRLSFDITGTNLWAMLHNPAGSTVYVDGITPATLTKMMIALPFRIN